MSEIMGFTHTTEPDDNLTRLADCAMQAAGGHPEWDDRFQVIILINDPEQQHVGMATYGYLGRSVICEDLEMARKVLSEND